MGVSYSKVLPAGELCPLSSWLSPAVRVDEGTRLGETGKGQHGSPRERVELSTCSERRLGSGFKPILQNSVQSPQALFPEQSISWRNTQTLPALRLTAGTPWRRGATSSG